MRLLSVEGVSGPSGSLLAELTAATFEREDAARRVWLDEQIKAGRTCRECGGRHGWARDAPGLCAACAKYPKRVPCRICGRPTKCSEGACGRHWQRVAKRHPPPEPGGRAFARSTATRPPSSTGPWSCSRR